MADVFTKGITAVLEQCEAALLEKGLPLGGEVQRVPHKWGFPPLFFSDGSKHPIAPLLRAFYYKGTSDSDVRETWTKMVEIISGPPQPVSVIRKVALALFPDYPFGGADHRPIVVALQFLMLVSMTEGRALDITRDRIMVTVGGEEIGVDRKVIVGFGSRYRVRAILPNVRLTLGQCNPYRPKSPVLASTNSIFQHLILNIPELSAVLVAVFSLAVRLGRRYERVITQFFYVNEDSDYGEGQIGREEALNLASALVEITQQNPIRRLSTLLTPHIGKAKFQDMFGNPYRRSSATYTLETRGRHRAAIHDLYDTGDADEKASLLSQLFGV